MASEVFATGKHAHDYAQIATDLLLARLHTHFELVKWLGNNPFTGRSLFSYLIRDLLDPPSLAENQGKKGKKQEIKPEIIEKQRLKRQEIG